MKKVLITLIVLSVAFCAFATEKLEYEGVTDFAFRPTSTRMEAMGKSGIAAPGRMDTFYVNSSLLCEKKFAMSFPAVTVTAYNLQKFLSEQANIDSLLKVMKNENVKAEMTNIGTAVLGNLGIGNNEVLTTDVAMGAKAGLFGFGIAVQEKLHATNSTGQLTAQNLVPEINALATVGVGFKVVDTPALSLNVGAAAHYAIKAYMKAQDATDILSLALAENADFKQYLTGTPTMVGYAIPIDLSVTLGLFYDTFRIAATANNINGKYSMVAYPGFATYLDSMGIKIDGAKPKDAEETRFDIKVPMTINAGVAWTPNWGAFKPVLTADITDLPGFIREKGKFFDKLLLHINAGLELNVINMVALRAGLNEGFMSVGASVGSYVLRVEASYYWREFGVQLGDKKVDALSIRINIGSDCN